MNVHSGLFMLTYCLLVLACNKDNEPLGGEDFIGEFRMDITHVSGLHTYYDSEGNIIDQRFDTVQHIDQTIAFSRSTADTFFVGPLFNSLVQSSVETQAFLRDDTLRFHHEFGEPQLRNDYIRGNAWLEGDSLFCDYRWDKSDIWSNGALPERGTVTASGIRL